MRKIVMVAGAAVLPWLVVLWATLPDTSVAQNWRLAWMGLDVLEAVGLLTTAWLMRRDDARAPMASIATAVLLVVDAWFDVTMSADGVAWLLALALELPLAAVCASVALRPARVFANV